MDKKVTIRDVAKHAGVSVASVSNVLNNINKVSEETKKVILDAIDELGYQMDFTARSLSNKKSNLVGIVLPVYSENVGATILLKDNPYFAEFISGIETICKEHHYDILITGIGKDESSTLNWVRKRNIDGVIFLGHFPKSAKEMMQKNRIPFVVTDNYEEQTEDVTSIVIDELRGGYIATKHLIELGHKNIALCGNGLECTSVNGLRYQGYKMALEQHKINLKEELIINTEVTLVAGKEAVEKIIKNNDITAIFCLGDILAVGVMKELQERGYKIPEDYSVIGFDDLIICKYITPELTTIRQDIFNKGIRAGLVMIGEILDNSKESYKEILPVKLIKRASTNINKRK